MRLLHAKAASDVLAGLPGSLAFTVQALSRRGKTRRVAKYYPQFADAFAVQIMNGRDMRVHRRLLGCSEAAPFAAFAKAGTGIGGA